MTPRASPTSSGAGAIATRRSMPYRKGEPEEDISSINRADRGGNALLRR
jgi:hypothetical protein